MIVSLLYSTMIEVAKTDVWSHLTTLSARFVRHAVAKPGPESYTAISKLAAIRIFVMALPRSLDRVESSFNELKTKRYSEFTKPRSEHIPQEAWMPILAVEDAAVNLISA
jgi:hypothetical protein